MAEWLTPDGEVGSAISEASNPNRKESSAIKEAYPHRGKSCSVNTASTAPHNNYSDRSCVMGFAKHENSKQAFVFTFAKRENSKHVCIIAFW